MTDYSGHPGGASRSDIQNSGACITPQEGSTISLEKEGFPGLVNTEPFADALKR